MSSDVEVAYHEAGHVVAMYALGLPVEYVTIVPDDDRAGHVQPAAPRTDPRGSVELFRDHICARLAGDLAEGIYTVSGAVSGYCDNRAVPFNLTQPDYAWVYDMIEIIVGASGPFETWSNDKRSRATEIVLEEQHRACDIMACPKYAQMVDTLAAALVREKTIAGGRVQGILAEVAWNMRQPTEHQ